MNYLSFAPSLFNKYLNSRNFYNGFYSSRKYEVELDWNNLELIKEQKIFLNIGKKTLTYQNIKEIIKLTIFDYSWNNHLNINNPEVKSEEIQVN